MTKGDVAPPKADNQDDCSTLTGATHESKARAYAAEASKEITLQYVKQIDDLKGEHAQTVADLQQKIDSILKHMSLQEVDAGAKSTNEEEYHNNDETEIFDENHKSQSEVKNNHNILLLGMTMNVIIVW